jgi:hypothetical protein
MQDATAIANIEFDGGELIGIITLHESGQCEMEALYPASGNWIWGERSVFRSEIELDAALLRFFKQLRKQKG